jgi:hypothetical protein
VDFSQERRGAACSSILALELAKRDGGIQEPHIGQGHDSHTSRGAMISAERAQPWARASARNSHDGILRGIRARAHAHHVLLPNL